MVANPLIDMGRTVAIMQPYCFPYIGYYQLVHAVDAFVYLDDVNYIKGGWIARNRILGPSGPIQFSIPLKGVSQNKLIDASEFADDPKWWRSFFKTVSQSYASSPNLDLVCDLIQTPRPLLLVDWIQKTNQRIFSYLGLEKAFFRASEIERPKGVTGPARIVSICKALGAERYINLWGGKSLYSDEFFGQAGIELLFLKRSDSIQYSQGKRSFVPDLSILDVLAWNPLESVIHDILPKYKLSPTESWDCSRDMGTGESVRGN
jgi:hypothetical protein